MTDPLIPQGEAFSLRKHGCFGTFRLDAATTESSQIYYLLTTFNVSGLSNLFTARDVGDKPKEIQFDDLLQREIIESHVENIETYLKTPEFPKEPRFLPPLLAGLVRVNGTEMEDFYPAPTLAPIVAGESYQKARLTWGNVAQLEWTTAPETFVGDTAMVSVFAGAAGPTQLRIIPSASQLALNTNAARLVVIDGQHRLQAIKQLLDDEAFRPQLKELSIPVLIFIPPWATSDARPTIRQTLRRIFVSVNTTARTVSGHFSILLDDATLSALAVRGVCKALQAKQEIWRMEWNQKEERLAYQFNSEHHMTTVGVLKNALMKSGARKPVTQAAIRLLFAPDSLALKGDSAEEESDFSLFDKWDAHASTATRPSLEVRIEKVVAPALSALFDQLKPFDDVKQVVTKILDAARSSGSEAAVDCFIRQSSPPLQAVKKAKYDALLSQIKEGIEDSGVARRLVQTQRFQQGLLNVYFELLARVEWRGMDKDLSAVPVTAAEQLAKELNSLGFGAGKGLLLTKDAPWLKGVVFRGEGHQDILPRQATAKHLAWLMGAIFGDETLARRFSKSVIGSTDLAPTLQDFGARSANSFWQAFTNSRLEAVIREAETTPSLSDKLRAKLLALLEKEKQLGSQSKKSQEVQTLRREKEEIASEAISDELDGIRAKLEKLLKYEVSTIDTAQGESADEE